MPKIDEFNGIKIYLYNGEHRPPHLHAIYGEHELLIEIESFKIYAGNLPAKKLKLVQTWLKENSEWTLEVFYQLNEHLR
jgi:hypothetical protein